MRIPNFFIVGAPKSGTTALSTYLGDHRGIFFSRPKELFFWDSDFPRSNEIHRIYNLETYLRFFDGAHNDHVVIGEGSTTYAQSDVAVKRIMEFNPSSKLIYMIRNPIEVAYAMHGELVRHHYEDEPDFEVAWELQDARRGGKRIPRNCFVPHQLIYRDVVDYPRQLRRIRQHAPESQLKVIIFDDFASDTRLEYTGILKFLGLADDDRTQFPKLHEAKQFRAGLVGRLVHNPPAMIAPLVVRARTNYLKLDEGKKKWIRQAFTKKSPRHTLDPTLRRRLAEELTATIMELSDLLDRDLRHWITPAAGTTPGQRAEL